MANQWVEVTVNTVVIIQRTTWDGGRTTWDAGQTTWDATHQGTGPTIWTPKTSN